MPGPVTIDVLVLSYGRDASFRSLTLRCLESLRDQRTQHCLRIWVAESHRGPEPAAEYLAVFQNCGADRSCRVWPSPLPFNFNQTLQEGLAFMEREPLADPQAKNVVLISNNDVVYAADCLERLVAALQQVDSVSPWMPEYHDRLHDVRDSANELIRGHQVRRHVAGWSYAFNRRILGLNEWLMPARMFPTELAFWYQDDFYGDVLEQNEIGHALVRSAHALHLHGSSHDLLADKQRATYGMKPVYDRLRKQLVQWKRARRWQRFWNWTPLRRAA